MTISNEEQEAIFIASEAMQEIAQVLKGEEYRHFVFEAWIKEGTVENMKVFYNGKDTKISADVVEEWRNK